MCIINLHNNNNEYLEHLTCTGPKRLHVIYKYIWSKFNAYNMNTHTHTHQSHFWAMRPKKKVFKKRKVFKEDLTELTGVEWQTETASWFQITGAW